MIRTSQAAVFHGCGHPLELQSISLPDLREGEILVRVRLTTLCGSDLHSYHGRRQVPVPTILGHEILGDIEQLGPAAPEQDLQGQPLGPGDRILWAMAVSCGHCFFCQQQLPQKCQQLFKFGHEALSAELPLTGGLATHCVLPRGTAILRVPSTVPDTLACPVSCATATVAAALRVAGMVRGVTVAVIGAGALGLTLCAMARDLGAARVLVCDLAQWRLAEAAHFGVDGAVSPNDMADLVGSQTSGRGADLVIEMSGSTEGVELGLSLLRTGGRVVLVGSVLPTRSVALNPEQVVRRCWTITGIHNYTPADLITALTWVQDQGSRWPLARLVGPTFPLVQAEAAFDWATQHPGVRAAVAP